MDIGVIETFIGKEIGFLRRENDREIFSRGILESVKNDCIVIDFRGAKQVYLISSIILIKELNKNDR